MPPEALALGPKRIVAAAEALGFTLHTVEPLRVIGYRKDLKAGFDARWKVAAKGTPFLSAVIRDPVGTPVELYFEYKPRSIRQGAKETEKSFNMRVQQAEVDAARQNYEYNDGAQRIEHEQYVTSTTPLHLFLNDWMDLLGIDAKRLPIPKPRAKKTEKIAGAMLAGEEWEA